MKLKLTISFAFISALPISANAVTDLEVQPQDVYRAAYCAEINRLSGFPDYEQVSESLREKESPFEGMILRINLEPDMPEIREDPISKLAAKLITGGDNLEYVDIGIEDARGEINFISSSELNQCNYDLVKILENYEWMPCGYGNLRQLNKLKAKMLLLKLEMVHLAKYE